jgi:hypothetical protein
MRERWRLAKMAAQLDFATGSLDEFTSVYKPSGGGAKHLRGTTTTRRLADLWTRTGVMVKKTKNGETYVNEVLRCKVPGCRTNREHLVLDDGTLCTKSTNLAKHYREKHPEAHAKISMKTLVVVKSDGTHTRTVELPFEQQLKHHIDYVFAVAEDTSALRTRCRDAMMKFIQNLHPGYKLPSEPTMKKILTAITDTQLREQMLVISAVKAAAKGGPAFGLQYDLWTKRKLRDAYMSLRLTYVTEDADRWDPSLP